MATKTFFDELRAYICGDGTAIARAAALMEESRARRAAFDERLTQELAGDIELVCMTFGRGPKNEPLWLVTVRRLGQHQVVRATMDLPSGMLPYDLSLAPPLADQIRQAWARNRTA